MRTGSNASAAVGEALRARVDDELLQAVRRVARMDSEHDRGDRDDRDGTQIVDRESLVAGYGLVDGKASGGRQYRVAVGCCGAHRLRREVSARAPAILDHHLLPDTLAELLRDEAGGDIGGAAAGGSGPGGYFFCGGDFFPPPPLSPGGARFSPHH